MAFRTPRLWRRKAVRDESFYSSVCSAFSLWAWLWPSGFLLKQGLYGRAVDGSDFRMPKNSLSALRAAPV
jgi:hypothetical protein